MLRSGWLRQFLCNRLPLAVVTVIAGSLISATLVRGAPGFDTDERLLDPRLNAQSRDAIRHASSAEHDILPYYLASVKRACRGDLGTSHVLNRPVRELVAERAAVTVVLLTKALLLVWVLSLALAFVASHFSSPALLDAPVTFLSEALLCLPAAALALLCVLLNQPAWVALALVLFPKVHRYVAAVIANVRQMPHVLLARAKGLSDTRVFLWHVLPVVRRELLAIVGISISVAIGAAIPVEALSSVPGLGQLAWQSALGRDLPVLTVLATLIVAGVVLANSGAEVVTELRGPA